MAFYGKQPDVLPAMLPKGTRADDDVATSDLVLRDNPGGIQAYWGCWNGEDKESFYRPEGIHWESVECVSLYPEHDKMRALLAAFFEINQQALQQEKLAMLNEVRARRDGVK